MVYYGADDAKQEFEGCRQRNVINDCAIQLLTDRPDRGDPQDFTSLVAKVRLNYIESLYFIVC